MKKPFASETGTTAIRVLVVMPIEEDQAQLELMLPSPKWIVHRARTLAGAVAQLRKQGPVPLLVCDRDLWPGTWRDMLHRLDYVNDPPFLIVTSRLADEQLWAEALNLGAYDVLSKPFDLQEVNRTLTSAWLRWRDCHAFPQNTGLAINAASA